MIVTMPIAHETHKRLGRQLTSTNLQGIKDQTEVVAYADSGAQTCASGPELLSTLSLDPSSLMPTSHRITGVTQAGMDTMDVLFVQIRAGSNSSFPAVHSQQQLKGLYLFE